MMRRGVEEWRRGGEKRNRRKGELERRRDKERRSRIGGELVLAMQVPEIPALAGFPASVSNPKIALKLNLLSVSTSTTINYTTLT